ncbi:mitochondrial ribosomal small subunit component [Ascosphaera atra]|nr:mitochondrial ribosomal small subunit component [Ascosphaera atra]
MGKFNLMALRVRQTAIAQLANGKTHKAPCWLDITSEVPPAQVLTRNQAVPHRPEYLRLRTDPITGEVHSIIDAPVVRGNKKKRAFKPRKIVYEEDELRRQFYKDHPWELARPRVVLENRGNDYKFQDWSKLQQPRKKLDGESVVQRQLWLLHNVPDITVRQAYDIARSEFYVARQEEQIERSVAHEEALATGAYFNPRMLDVGMQMEDAAFDHWKKWSEQELLLQEARLASFAGASTAPEEADPLIAEEEEAAVAAPAAEEGEGQKKGKKLFEEFGL